MRVSDALLSAIFHTILAVTLAVSAAPAAGDAAANVVSAASGVSGASGASGASGGDDAATWVWWEGEDPVATNFPDRTWFSPRPQERALLSGGDWLTHMGERPAGSEPAFARYEIKVPETATYEVWARKMWRHGPFRWRFGDGPWHVCGRDVALADSVTLRTHVPANWVHLGAVDLEAGNTTFEVELLAEEGESLAAGCDAFIITTGVFFPNAHLKPGERFGRADPGRFAFEPAPDPFSDEAMLDLRHLNEDEAGAVGRVRREGDRLVLGDGTPVRFWAVNVSSANAAGERRSVDYLARRLAKLGVNMVRYHSPLFDRAGDVSRLDEGRLDNLHYLVAAMKREGIYVTLSTWFPLWYQVRPGDGLEGYEQIANKRPFGLPYFNPRMQALHRGWLEQMLSAENPYTGLPLGRDPAVAMVELVNEDSLFFWTFTKRNVPPPQWRMLEGRFADWLIERHGGLAEAVAAWGGGAHDGDDHEAGRMVLYEAWHLTRDGLRQTARQQAMRHRLGDQARFYTELQKGFYARMGRFLRDEVGYEGLVIASNWKTADPALLDGLERYTYTAADVIDRHGYFDPPHEGEGASYSVRVGHRFESRAAVRQPARLPITVYQVAGYPHIISEVNWPHPNRYRADMTLILAAYGALQGIDGLYPFAMGSNYVRDTSMGKFALGSPATVGTFPAAALMYRRGDVATARPAAVNRVELERLYALEGERLVEAAGLEALRRADAPVDADGDADGDRVRERAAALSFYMGPVLRVFMSEAGGEGEDARPPAVPEPGADGSVDLAAGRITSHGGELAWDFDTGIITVRTQRSVAAAGFLAEAGPIDLNGIELRSANEYGSFIITALDDRPLADSRRILVQAMTEDRPYGFAKADGVIEALGSFPFGVVRIDAELRWPWAADDRWTATPLDENGYAAAGPILPTRRDGRMHLQLPAEAVWTILER